MLKVPYRFCFFFFVILKCDAQDFKLYNETNSILPHDEIVSIAIDQQGNKWIGTSQNGLYKYDGEKFNHFDNQNSAIKGNYVYNIFVDSKNNVWIDYSVPESGTVMFNGKNWVDYSKKKGVLYPVCEDQNGNLYFGAKNKVLKFANNVWSTIKLPFDNKFIYAIDVNSKGAIAIGFDEGLLFYENNHWKKYTVNNSKLTLNVVEAVQFSPSGDLYIGYGGGLGNGGFSILKNNQFINYDKHNSSLPDQYVRDIKFGKDGVIWMGTNDGFVSIKGNIIQPIFFKKGKYQNTILDFAIDRNTIWLATTIGLIEYNSKF